METHDYSHLPEPPEGLCYGTVALISFNPDGKVMMSIDNPTGRSLHFWDLDSLRSTFGVKDPNDSVGTVVVLQTKEDDLGFHSYKMLGLPKETTQQA